jgi:hypothetical protein
VWDVNERIRGSTYMCPRSCMSLGSCSLFFWFYMYSGADLCILLGVCAISLVHCCALFYEKEHCLILFSVHITVNFLLTYFVVGIKVAVS